MKTYVLGNWKSHGGTALVAAFRQMFETYDPACPQGFQRGLALPFHLLQPDAAFHHALLGAQNVSAFGKGAYTGEIAATMLADTSASFCLVGHSERRQYFGETPAVTAEKLARLEPAGILPVFCIGETLAEREAGSLEAVLKAQLEPVAQAPPKQEIVIAYEPVWAIGTGVAAKPDDVVGAHKRIKAMLVAMGRPDTAVLYGGSVKPENARTLGEIAQVDGFLIGGASLKTEAFQAILEAFLTAKAS